MAPRRFCDPCGVQHRFQFAASPLKDRLRLQRQLLRKNYSNELRWNHKQEEEFKTVRRVLSDSSQMLQPFNPALAMGLVVDTAKTMGIGFILLENVLRVQAPAFVPSSPPQPINFITAAAV